MADLDITGSVRVDASQAEGAFDRLGQRANRMAGEIAGAATRAGDAAGRIGAGAARGGDQFTRSQSRLRDEIIKSTRAVEELGKSASQRFELKIQTRGLDPAQFSPYLNRLREVENAQAQQAARAAQAARATATNADAMRRASDSANQFGNALKGLAAAYGASQLVSLTDQYVKFNAQLKLASTSASEFSNSIARVRSISTEAQQDISAVGVLYARVANSTRELGVSQSQVGDIVRSVALSLAVSGASATEAASATLQLSQAFASGVLRGEEFNAVNEAAPRLMKALAEGIGQPVGALRKMAEAGLLTSEVLAGALPKALGELGEEVKEITTISGAFTIFNNELLQFVGASATSSGAVKVITTSILTLADSFNTLAAVGIGVALAKVTSVLGTLAVKNVEAASSALASANAAGVQRAALIATAQAEVAGTAATTGRLAATKAAIEASRQQAVAALAGANATAAQATAQVAAARSAGAQSFAITALAQGELALTAAQRARSASMAELALLGQQQARVSAQITAATLAQTAAQTALTAANTAGGASAALATRALGFLGGPIGAVTTLLGLGATAWLLWGNSAKKNASEAAGAIESSTEEILVTLDKQISKLKERNALARAGLPEIAQSGGEAAARLAALQKQIDNLQSGRGPTGGAALPEVARVAVLQTLLRQYGTLAEKIREVDVQQKSLDSFGKETKAGEWMAKYATNAEKLTAELALARKELGAAFSPEIEARIRKQYEVKAAGAGGAAAAIKKEASEYEKLITALRGKTSANELELVSVDALTESQKLRVKLDTELATGALKLTAINEQAVRAEIERLAVSEKALKLEQDGIKSREATIKLIEDAQQAEEKTVAAAIAAAVAAENQLAQYGLLKSEVMALTLARLEDARESAALAGEDVSNIEKRIDAQRRLNAATIGLDARKAADETADAALKASTKAAADAATEWQKTADSINNSLTDALLRGFESGKDFAANLKATLINMFKTLILRPTISAILAPVAGAFSGNAMAGQGGSDLISTLQSGFSSLNSSISTGIGNAFSKFATSSSGQSLGLSTTVGEVFPGQGASLTAGGQIATQALQVAGNAMAGYALGTMAQSLISGGFTIGKGMENFQKAGIAVASAFFGPVGGAVAGAIAGGINRVFGRKLKDSGIEGTFGGQEGFTGNSFEFLKGGLLRSDKTNRTPLDEEASKGLGDAFNAMRVQVGTFATALGLDTDRIAGFTSTIKLSLKGLKPEEADAKIKEALATANNSLAEQVLGSYKSTIETVIDQIQSGSFSEGTDATFSSVERQVTTSTYTPSEFAREGETASGTLTRLSTSLTTVNGVFDALGATLYKTSLAGADMASSLVDAFGGMDAFAGATSSYYEAFYSEQERTDTALRQLAGTLSQLGLALPDAAASDALAQYRALVDAQDLNTEAGLTGYAALVTLGSGFAQLVTSTQSLAQAAGDATASVDAMVADLKQQTSIRLGLERDLLELQGDAAALRLLDIQGMDASNVALFDRITALGLEREAAQAAAQAAKTLADSRFDLENRLLAQAGQGGAVQQRTDARDLAALTDGLPDDMAAKVRAQFDANVRLREQYEGNERAIESMRTGLADLERQQQATQASQRTMLQGTVTSASKAVQDLRSIFDLLGNAIDSLRGGVASSVQMQADQALAFIRQANVLMRSGGVVDAGKLQGAIRSATAGIEQTPFANSAEEDFARLKLAGELALLQGGTAGQLTIAEQHLSIAQQQLDTLGVIASAITNLAGAQDAARGLAKDQWSNVAGQNVYASSGGAVGVSSGTDINIYGKDGSEFLGSEAIAYVRNQIAANDAASVYAAATKTGISSIALDQLMGWDAGTSNAWADLNMLPKFAVGTNYVPRDMYAQIHEGEAIIPRAYNPAANPGMGGNNERLESLVEALTQEVKRLQDIQQANSESSATTAEVLVRVTNNGNGLMTAPAPI